MGLITYGTVMLDGQRIQNLKNFEISEKVLAEASMELDGIDFRDKTPVPGFVLRIFKKSTSTEPTWSSFNEKLAVLQEDGGNRYAYSEIRLIREGNYVIERDTEQVKEIEFQAKRVNVT